MPKFEFTSLSSSLSRRSQSSLLATPTPTRRHRKRHAMMMMMMMMIPLAMMLVIMILIHWTASVSTLTKFKFDYNQEAYAFLLKSESESESESSLPLPKRRLPRHVLSRPLLTTTTTTAATATTIFTTNDDSPRVCRCELVSTDCLDSMDCLPSTREESDAVIQQGMQLRRILQTTAVIGDSFVPYMEGPPVGKQTHYIAMDIWHGWTAYQNPSDKNKNAKKQRQHILPRTVETDPEGSIFLNETDHAECEQHGWKGRACFFRPLTDLEDWQETMPDAAQNPIDHKDSNDEQQQQQQQQLTRLQDDLQAYLAVVQTTKQHSASLFQRSRRRRKNEPDDDKTKQQEAAAAAAKLPALGHLLTYSYCMRLAFFRRRHVRDFYQSRLTTHWTTNNSQTTTPHKDNNEDYFPLRVSLHLRRADSCGAKQWETQASPLDSSAQPTHIRKCYTTSVYLDGLREVQTRTSRPIEVYLSSDHANSLLEEIQQRHADIYHSVAAWHVLDFENRFALFNYKGAIDLKAHSQHAILGESAVADLWHLSHGEVMVGHLGSRFGKVAWFLATARYNRFIPFFTVDGHSVCCEIDENCHKAAPYIRSMDNCLTFAHERSGMPGNATEYWSEIGSTKRIRFGLKQQEQEAQLQEKEQQEGEKG